MLVAIGKTKTSFWKLIFSQDTEILNPAERWFHGHTTLGGGCVMYPELELLQCTRALLKTLRGIIKKKQILFHSSPNPQLCDSGTFFFSSLNKTLASWGTWILLNTLWGKIL